MSVRPFLSYRTEEEYKKIPKLRSLFFLNREDNLSCLIFVLSYKEKIRQTMMRTFVCACVENDLGQKHNENRKKKNEGNKKEMML